MIDIDGFLSALEDYIEAKIDLQTTSDVQTRDLHHSDAQFAADRMRHALSEESQDE